MNDLEKLKNRIIENGGNEEMELKKIINVRVFSITAEELEVPSKRSRPTTESMGLGAIGPPR